MPPCGDSGLRPTADVRDSCSVVKTNTSRLRAYGPLALPASSEPSVPFHLHLAGSGPLPTCSLPDPLKGSSPTPSNLCSQGHRGEEPVQGKGYLARVKDTLWVRDVLGTELVPGHQSLNVIVELHDAAVVLDPEDKAVCLQTRLGIIIAGNGRKFGLNQGFLQGHHELLGFRVTKQNLGTGYWLSPSHPLLREPLQEGVSATPWARGPCAVLCLVAQSCLTLCDLMDCSPPGSSVHGDSPGKNTGMDCHALLQGIFSTQGWNPGLLHCRKILILYHLSHQGSPRILPSLGELPDSGIELGSPVLQADCLPAKLSRKPWPGHGQSLKTRYLFLSEKNLNCRSSLLLAGW